jgi:MFS family permease
MVEHMPNRRALALGVHLTGGMMAEVVGPLLVGFLLVYLDWQFVFRIAVVPAILMGVSLLYFHRHILPSHEPAITKADLAVMLRVWRTPAGMAMFGLGVTYSLSFVALMAMSPLYFQDYHGYSSAWAGGAFAAMLLGGVVAAPLVGQLSDRWGRKPVVVISAVLGAAGILLTAFSSHPVLLVLGVVVAGTALSGMRPVYLAAAVEMIGRRESTSLGLIYGIMDGLGAVGAVLAGLAGSNDLRYALAFAAAAALASAIFALAHPFKVAMVGPLLTEMGEP